MRPSHAKSSLPAIAAFAALAMSALILFGLAKVFADA